MSQQQPSPRFPQSPLTLEFPMSLGVYEKYADVIEALYAD